MYIGLFGFTAAHENLGCQALTYSFLNILKKNLVINKDILIIFTYNTAPGRLRSDFPDLKIEFCKISLIKNRKEFISKLKLCDLIFDETFGDGFSDIYFTRSAYKDAFIKYIISKLKLPLILTPQTYGPFYHKSLEIISGNAIKNAYKVYARDSLSQKYASRISKREVLITTDLAFNLPYKKQQLNKNQIKLGLNVSGLLWQGGFNKNNQFKLCTDYQKYCKKLIEHYNKNNYEIHLIPHVTTPGDKHRIIPDSDIDVCNLLHKIYPFTILAPLYNSPIEIKGYIASLNYFIGARMHSTIAAFSSGVITVPFAYSRKFQGLFEDLEYPIYIDGRILETEEAIEKTIQYIKEADHLKDLQNNSLKIIQTNIDYFNNEIRSILNNAR